MPPAWSACRPWPTLGTPIQRRRPFTRRKQILRHQGHLLPWLALDRSGIGPGEPVTARVTVTNTGKRAGEEAVLLYLGDLYASVTPAVISVAHVVEDLVHDLEFMLQERNAKVEDPDDLPSVRYDPTHLSMVFRNLIVNGVKYNQNSEKLVRISARREAGAWEFSVSDNGIGIEPEHAERIFQVLDLPIDEPPQHSAADTPQPTGGIEICDELMEMVGEGQRPADYEVRAGRGVAAVEVPRGILFHEYELDAEGRVVAANVITPTAQNLANVERDMRHAVESMIREDRQMPEPKIKAGLEMVARAYDPCISCSVHVTRLDGE